MLTYINPTPLFLDSCSKVYPVYLHFQCLMNPFLWIYWCLRRVDTSYNTSFSRWTSPKHHFTDAILRQSASLIPNKLSSQYAIKRDLKIAVLQKDLAPKPWILVKPEDSVILGDSHREARAGCWAPRLAAVRPPLPKLPENSKPRENPFWAESVATTGSA